MSRKGGCADGHARVDVCTARILPRGIVVRKPSFVSSLGYPAHVARHGQVRDTPCRCDGGHGSAGAGVLRSMALFGGFPARHGRASLVLPANAAQAQARGQRHGGPRLLRCAPAPDTHIDNRNPRWTQMHKRKLATAHAVEV